MLVHVMANTTPNMEKPVAVQYSTGSVALECVLVGPLPLIVISPFSKDDVVSDTAKMLKPMPKIRNTMVCIFFFICCPNVWLRRAAPELVISPGA